VKITLSGKGDPSAVAILVSPAWETPSGMPSILPLTAADYAALEAWLVESNFPAA